MKILMVCLGNICRSPLAEGILRNQAENKGLKLTVDSAGTASYHVGEPPHKDSIRVAGEHGIDITGLRAQQFKAEDFDSFDRIYVMDTSNYSDVIRLANNENQRKKVRLILNEIHPGKDESVPDPWYGGYDGYIQVFDLLNTACNNLLEQLSVKSSTI